MVDDAVVACSIPHVIYVSRKLSRLLIFVATEANSTYPPQTRVPLQYTGDFVDTVQLTSAA
jgi:hypothetical protein